MIGPLGTTAKKTPGSTSSNCPDSNQLTEYGLVVHRSRSSSAEGKLLDLTCVLPHENVLANVNPMPQLDFTPNTDLCFTKAMRTRFIINLLRANALSKQKQ